MFATVVVDGNFITGRVYHVRDNGWKCVETDSGRCASGPDMKPQTVVDYPYPFSVGPRLIRNVVCPDGSQRTAYCSAQGADTFFSIPASVCVNRTRVAGYVTRETLQGYSTEMPNDPAVWKFIPYTYRKNHTMLERKGSV